MGKFREEMRKGRAILHQKMGDRANIFAYPFDEDDDGNPVAPDISHIKVRVHEKFDALGDLKGTNYKYAEMEDNAPIAVFWLNIPTGFKPERGMAFVTEYGRVYIIDSTFPADDQTQNAKVNEVLGSRKAEFPEYENE